MRIIKTPVGKYPVPQDIQREIDPLNDEELISKCIKEEIEITFISPFLYNEINHRGIYLKYSSKRQEVKYK